MNWLGEAEKERLCRDDARIPEQLRMIRECPERFEIAGEIPEDLAGRRLAAIVGSRKADIDGCHLASQIAESLAGAGVTIVSGLAHGIDAAAHEGALRSGRRCSTIAVLGHGLDHLYPAANRRLAETILKTGGLLISQFAADMRPFPQNFLDRNRVISGLCSAVIIIQAPLKSGSMATARFAVEEGREVFVMPGSVRDPKFEGSHKLLKEGAYLLTGVEDVYEVFPGWKEAQDRNAEEFNLPGSAGIICQRLKTEAAVHYEMLIAGLEDGATVVLDMELRGLIERMPGNWFVLGKSAGL